MSDSGSDDNDNGPPWGIAGNSICMDWTSDPNAVWPYCPSVPAAVLFEVLFTLSTFIHIVQAITYRKGFCWVIAMAGFWELGGFAFRIASTQFQGSVGLYFGQLVMILLAPLWVNAFVYMVFGRMVLYFTPDQKIWIFKARRLTLCFVLLDIFIFLVQLAGGSMLGSTDSNTINTGKSVYMAGLGIQITFFTAFLGLAILFNRRMQSIPNARPTKWEHLLRIIYSIYALITIRIVYRLVEYSDGFDGPVPHTESYFYIFDSLMMLAAIVVFNIYHPGRVLIGPESEFKRLTKAEKKQQKVEKKRLKEYRKVDRNMGIDEGPEGLPLAETHGAGIQNDWEYTRV